MTFYKNYKNMKALQNLYNRITLGKDHRAILADAAVTCSYIQTVTKGGRSLYLDHKGERVRGIHRRIRFSEKAAEMHPLEKKYSFED